MAPVTPDRPEQYEILIIGAGFNGLYQLWRLRNEGFSVRIVEASPGLGGVWQANRYPGARVDSHIPNYEFSMEPVWRDWTWKERFPGRDELVAYFDHVDEVLDLRPDIDLNTRVTAAHYRPDERRWTVTAQTRDDDGVVTDVVYDCRYLVPCTGFGSAPYVPDIPGLHDFEGIAHHTATWPAEGVSFAGKRVGVIGTGASGVQVTQEAAKDAAQLYVFQRSPVMALPMEQRRLDADEQNAAKADYPEMFRRRNSPPGSFHDIGRVDLSALEVDDEERDRIFSEAWAKGGFHFWVGTFRDILLDEAANRTAYEFWRDRTRARINDPHVADLLAPMEPPYPFGTKRPSLEQGYYECFNQPNVGLVDLLATPMERITPTGVRLAGADGGEGTEIELDVLVLATGFDANTGGLTTIDIRGTGGESLAEAWSEGVDTHLGMAIPGFPNLLMLYGPQSATAFCNGPVCAEVQGDWLAALFSHLRDAGLTRIETTMDVARAWSGELDKMAEGTLFGKADSWYMGANIPGKRRQLLNFPSSDAYLAHLDRCAANNYDGFVLD